MRYLRAGPERDAAIQRMRNHWAAQDAALRRGSFPVVGLAPPFPGPVALGGTESVNGEVTRVGLLYGGHDPAAGPRVTVSTAPAPRDAESLPVADVLRDALQDVLRDETDDADVLPDRAVAEVTVLLDGVPQVTHTLGNEQGWAAITRVGIDGVALLVTIAAHGWPLSELRLAHVDDLEPFLAGRRERVEAALARAGTQPGPEDWELPPAEGLEGHRALADMMVAMARANEEAGGPRREAPLPSGYAQRWEVAIRAQMALAGQPREQAEDAVHSMANHLGQLARAASWFGNPDLADRATAETIAHVAVSRDVPSAAAQRAWSAYWTLHGQRPREFTALTAAQDAWLTAWQRWAERG